jgi:hypothetical protein
MAKFKVLSDGIPSLKHLKVQQKEGSKEVVYSPKLPAIDEQGQPTVVDQPGARNLRCGDIIDESFFSDKWIDTMQPLTLKRGKFIEEVKEDAPAPEATEETKGKRVAKAE